MGPKELERRGRAFCRYADDRNIYVRTRRAGALWTLARHLRERLKLKVNAEKSAVDRPWKRKFLGYSMTSHKRPRLKVASASLARLRDKLRERFRQGQGRNLARFIKTLTPALRGWADYFHLAGVKGSFEKLDGWIRRKPRCIMWRQCAT